MGRDFGRKSLYAKSFSYFHDAFCAHTHIHTYTHLQSSLDEWGEPHYRTHS